MIEAGRSARRVARQLGRSDCIVRRCWGQWIREMSFTRRPGSGRPRQTNRREDSYIVRNARVQPTASSVATQRKHLHWGPLFLLEPYEGAWLKDVWDHDTNYVGESRFNLSSYDDRVFVWRPRVERINPAFALQRHTTPTAGVIVWGVIVHNTRLTLVLIRGIMTSQRLSQDCLRTVTTFPWPTRFPDLSPIEHIWDNLGKASWTSHEFERTRVKGTANME
ncbi:transposable element Tcb2 transposase [Trichonephila clavipes]|nr:transposable element Tcb2 transposase [Trichonephila clavipes]